MFRGRLRKALHPSVIRNISEPYLYAVRNEVGHHFYIYRAHVIMLMEQQLLKPEEARRILQGLSEMEGQDIYAGDLDVGTDLYMNVEAQLIKRVGEVGGKMHIGRSRNDIYATTVRMEIRNQILTIVEHLIQLIQAILAVARVHVRTVMPGYTHWQHAQPVTLAHYLTGITQALSRDLDRLASAYGRTNVCPLGAAALATTGFPIDRERVASLLGFDGVLENSYDSVASRDFLAEYAAALAIVMTTLSRLAEDLIMWSTAEFSVVDMPEEFSATSSIMPQKKNPFVLEHVKGRTGHVIAAATSVLAVLKGTSFSHSREVGAEAPSAVHTASRLVQGCLEMLSALFPQLDFNKELMEQRTTQGFSTVTELADFLVRERDLSFRQAHNIIGQIVNELLDNRQGVEALSSAMIDQASRQVVGRDLLLAEEDVRRALDPSHNVEIRDIPGGPAPRAVEKLISRQREQLRKKKAWFARCQYDLEKAEKTCGEAESRVLSAVKKTDPR